jgi:hypothetical protein
MEEKSSASRRASAIVTLSTTNPTGKPNFVGDRQQDTNPTLGAIPTSWDIKSVSILATH